MARPVTDSSDIHWGRRLATTTFWFVAGGGMFLTLPLVMPFVMLFDVVRRQRLSLTRTWLFFTWFFLSESLALVAALWLWLRHLVRGDDEVYELANRRLQRRWANGLFWGCCRLFDVEVRLQGQEALDDETPALVLCRHATTLDTMLPIAAAQTLKRFRYVIKAELLFDPCMDVVAHRFPNAFVRRGGHDPEREVQRVLDLARELEPGALVVVYPEGTRFSPQGREKLIARLREKNDPAVELAESLRMTLPPLREGGVRLVQAMPDADVIFIAHRGVEVRSMRHLVGGALTGSTYEVQMWRVPAESVPRDSEGIRTFLAENWRRIDRFAQGEPEPAVRVQAEDCVAGIS